MTGGVEGVLELLLVVVEGLHPLELVLGMNLGIDHSRLALGHIRMVDRLLHIALGHEHLALVLLHHLRIVRHLVRAADHLISHHALLRVKGHVLLGVGLAGLLEAWVGLVWIWL